MKGKFNFWPLGIVLVLALFFIGIMTLVVIASSQRFDLVSENYYAEELSYQKQIDGIERARRAGARMEVDDAKGQLAVDLGTAGSGQAEEIRLAFYRPSAAGLDRTTNIEAGTDGRAIVNLSGLEPGLWKVRASWETGGKPCLLEGVITNFAGMGPRSNLKQ